MKNVLNAVIVVSLLLLISGCGGVYYGVMEKIGVHKRDILVDRVIDARDSQHATKAQFASALEHFSMVINFQGDELEDKYHQLKKELNKSEDQADEVRDRVDAVEDVAEALFDEWERELDQYSSASLRKSSENS